MKSPFFILGCPRSGSTLLRNLLRMHPGLSCPEETHFFRWPFAFAGADFNKIQQNNPTLAEHRKMDGIAPEAFSSMLEKSASRRELQNAYAMAFLKTQGGRDKRWFDKTPQNTYGLLLLSASYPEAKFVHIHRHPFNVIASLMTGKVMSPHSLMAAINTWMESALIIQEYQRYQAGRVIDIAYEKITSNPNGALDEICRFIEEPEGMIEHHSYNIHPEQNKYKKLLSSSDLDLIRKMLGLLMDQYTYE